MATSVIPIDEAYYKSGETVTYRSFGYAIGYTSSNCKSVYFQVILHKMMKPGATFTLTKLGVSLRQSGYAIEDIYSSEVDSGIDIENTYVASVYKISSVYPTTTIMITLSRKDGAVLNHAIPNSPCCGDIKLAFTIT